MTEQPSQHRVRFALSGPSEQPDPRVNAYRADIADMALAGRIFAHYYAFPSPRSCIVAHAALHATPDPDAPMTSELLFGERFAVIDRSEEWAWGFCTHDHYVGYLSADALGEADMPAKAMLGADSDVHQHPDSASPVTTRLPMGARIDDNARDGWIETALGFMPQSAILVAPATDPVAIAQTLIGAPYVWGGRTRAGIDCSGLVQLAFALCSTALPRDSDQQMAGDGEEIADNDALERGDVVFFPDHVGLMADAATLFHATHFHGKVVAEPLADVVARIAAEHDAPILGRKRFSV